MAFSATIIPGKVFEEGEAVNITTLNQLGNPTVNIEGAIDSVSLGAGAVSDTNVASNALIAVSKLAVGSTSVPQILVTADTTGVPTYVTPTGDVTIDNAGATTIGDDKVLTDHILDNNVTTAKLLDSNVTYAKLQDTVTANRVLGAATAGTISEVQVATDMIADAAVTETKLSATAPNTDKFLMYDASAGAGSRLVWEDNPTATGGTGQGIDSGTYNSSDGKVTISYDGALADTVTDDLRGADSTVAGPTGQGIDSGSYAAGTGKVTISYDGALADTVTDDLRGADGNDSTVPGPTGQGIDSGSYNSSDGKVTISYDGALADTVTDDLRGADGDDSTVPGPTGQGIDSGSYNSSDGKVTISYDGALADTVTDDLRGADGNDGATAVAADNIQVYTSSNGDFTVPAGVTKLKIQLWGGGGGGGFHSSGAASGGGGGAYLLKHNITVVAGADLAYTVGAGGAAITTQANGTGNDGAATTFTDGTTTYSAGGGSGGIMSSDSGERDGGAGGTVTGGNINIAGQPGRWAINDVYHNMTAGGAGAMGGAGGHSMNTDTDATRNGQVPGGGGGGFVKSGYVDGSSGAAGMIIIEW